MKLQPVLEKLRNLDPKTFGLLNNMDGPGAGDLAPAAPGPDAGEDHADAGQAEGAGPEDGGDDQQDGRWRVVHADVHGPGGEDDEAGPRAGEAEEPRPEDLRHAEQHDQLGGGRPLLPAGAEAGHGGADDEAPAGA